MKTKIASILFIAICFTVQLSFAQAKGVVTDTIKVYGNCTMCKNRIETALDHKGIKQAKWDPKTKDLVVAYNPSKITEQQIHEIVASVGHDTDKVKAKVEVYSGLPFCCLYRDHEMKDDH